MRKAFGEAGFLGMKVRKYSLTMTGQVWEGPEKKGLEKICHNLGEKKSWSRRMMG